jgi:ABC-type uncharacterized transport system permease subunit
MTELLTTDIFINLLTSMILVSTPLLLAAMGELVTERAGVMNMGVEGMMLMGAFVGFVVTFNTDSHWSGVLAAALAGGLMALILGFLAISLRVDQTVSGLALNLLSVGLTVYIFRVFFSRAELTTVELLPVVPIPWLSEIPFIGEIFFSQRILTYFAFLSVPVIAFLLNRTKLGLTLRSTGENPRAVDTSGSNVSKLRFLAVVFGGMMAGLAGSFLTNGMVSRFVPGITAGRGWLAIIIVIAGNWQPARIVAAALIFSFLDAFQFTLQGIGSDIPFQLLLSLPYIFALVALMSSRARSRMPGVLGIPYDKE